MDTNTINPTVSPTAAVVTKRPRIKDSVALGICQATGATVKIIDSTAEVVGAVAIRLKLHNVATAADIITDYGKEAVSQGQELISKL